MVQEKEMKGISSGRAAVTLLNAVIPEFRLCRAALLATDPLTRSTAHEH